MTTNVQRVIDYCENETFHIGDYDEMTRAEDLHNALLKYKNGNIEVIRHLHNFGCPSCHGLDEADMLCDDMDWHKYHQEERPEENLKVGFPVCEECWNRALGIEV